MIAPTIIAKIPRSREINRKRNNPTTTRTIPIICVRDGISVADFRAAVYLRLQSEDLGRDYNSPLTKDLISRGSMHSLVMLRDLVRGCKTLFAGRTEIVLLSFLDSIA
jgi:hypothetical protein